MAGARPRFPKPDVLTEMFDAYLDELSITRADFDAAISGAYPTGAGQPDKSLLNKLLNRLGVTEAELKNGLDLKAMAVEFARAYRREKKASKEVGAELRALPGVHHPIFKGKPVNHDPRERFVAEYMAKAGRYNVFHAFYRELVQALYEQGASPYVFCVNVDAVIAALLLALLWPDYQAGRLSERDLETAAFTVFLYGRMIGSAAEIDDHLNRGRNMDTRTPASQCGFVV